MLKTLFVKNLALIQEISIDFEQGFNVLTGETGAGKSILMGSIALALGGRYTKDMIRTGAEYGYVELTFTVSKEEMIRVLAELDIFPEEGCVTLSRRLMDGKSVSKVNGETVSMNQLRTVARQLIAIHGQQDSQILLKDGGHLSLLDAFGGEELALCKATVKEAYEKYCEKQKALEFFAMDEARRQREEELLAYEVEELRSADLKCGEDVELEQQFETMSHGKQILESVARAYEYSAGQQNSASDGLGRGLKCLAEVMRYDKRAEELYEQLSQVENLLNDLNRELSDYMECLQFSEEAFEQVQGRLNTINRLKMRYGGTIEEIHEALEKKEEALWNIQEFEERKETAVKEEQEARRQLQEQCEKLTKLRKAYARELEQELARHLRDLNFEETNFAVCVREGNHFGAAGRDQVEFLVSLNPGEPLKPLSEIASGGELSRIMLAIKTVLADKEGTETLIFDEIDTGISGRTAQKVSEKLTVIAKNRQVICITHLAQIAAMADHHYCIAKRGCVAEAGGKVVTTIEKLEESESIQELARILGGASITETVLENAKEMRMLAKKSKQ